MNSRAMVYGLLVGGTLFFGFMQASQATALPPPLSISQVPLLATHYGMPNILFILDNSQSMDGDLSGAIMTGSGTATSNGGSSTTINANSSSPADYTVPAGFTAPVTNATSGTTPYTVCTNGICTDNSASRLNVAKEAILQSYNQWNGLMNFGLMDYGVNGNPSVNTTWVYYMSGPGGFSFGTSPSAPTQTTPQGTVVQLQAVPNPCHYSNTQNTYSCQQIHNFFTSNGVSGSFSDEYLYIQDTSDEPNINDVLYAGSGLPSNFITYGGPNPGNPYTNYGLQEYNSGSINEEYYNSIPDVGSFNTGPTNAGYVPYSPEVWYSERGFGYYNNISNTGNLVVPIATSNTSQLNAFESSLAPETNNPGSSEIKADAVNAPMSETLQSALSYLTGNTLPSSNGCSAPTYVIFITDGLPTVSNSGALWPPLGSAAAEGYQETATFNSNGTINSTNDRALTDTISALQELADNGIKTYIIGVGAGVDPKLNPVAADTLQAMALAGDTAQYFPATSPAAVASDISVILKKVEKQLSTTGVALNASSNTAANLVYQASFNTKFWTGNLLAETLSSVYTSPSSPSIQWEAVGTHGNGTLTASSLSNKVFTWNPVCNGNSGCGEPFVWSSLSTTQQSELEQGWSSLSGSQQATFGGNSATYGQAIMSWLLTGNTSGGIFRSPEALLGDIVDSSPVYVGAPDQGLLTPSYQSFAQQYASRTPMVYVGSNDGLLYGFNALTGSPIFAYVPQGVYHDLWKLPQLNYTHRFYVDGTPSEADIETSSGSWESILVGGLDDGGDAIYALNVTNPASFSASDVLWQFTSSDLGRTYSEPQLAEVEINGTPTWVAVFGSGYNSPAGWPYLFIVNAMTGKLIKSVNLCKEVNYNSAYCSTNYPDGLSTPALASSGNGFLAGTAYVGDLQGNLWDINLTQLLNPSSAPSPSAPPTVSVLFHATTTSTTNCPGGATSCTVPQPITTQPLVTTAPAGAPAGNFVLFGTGQLLQTSDLSNTSVQSIYGILSSGNGNIVTLSQLQQRAITGVTSNNGEHVVVELPPSSGNGLINWAMQKGWYMNLTDSANGNLPVGLRSISNMEINLNRLIFTMYAPSSDTCGGTGTSYLMIINYIEGTTFSQPQFFVNNNLTQPLTVNSQYVSGVSLGDVYANTPTQAGNHLLVPLGNGTISSFVLPSPPVSPIGWRSIIAP